MSWLDRLLSRINGTAEPRDRKRRDVDSSVGFYDSTTSSPSSGNSIEYVADGPSTSDGSLDAAFGGGESGGGGASADYGSGDSGGGDSGGGDSGGGDGGGGGD